MNRSIVSMLLATFVLRVSTAVTGIMLVFLVDEMTRHRGTGPGEISLLTGGFYTTELAGAIVFGVLADRYGRKVIMLLGPVFGGVAVFMTGLTTHLPVLFVTRLLEGSSTAASIPSTLGFIAAETADDEVLRGRVVSLFEFVSLGGMLAIGPALRRRPVGRARAAGVLPQLRPLRRGPVPVRVRRLRSAAGSPGRYLRAGSRGPAGRRAGRASGGSRPAARFSCSRRRGWPSTPSWVCGPCTPRSC